MSGHRATGGDDVDGLHAARARVQTFHADHDELWMWGLPLLARQQRCGSGSGNSAAVAMRTPTSKLRCLMSSFALRARHRGLSPIGRLGERSCWRYVGRLTWA